MSFQPRTTKQMRSDKSLDDQLLMMWLWWEKPGSTQLCSWEIGQRDDSLQQGAEKLHATLIRVGILGY